MDIIGWREELFDCICRMVYFILLDGYFVLRLSLLLSKVTNLVDKAFFLSGVR